MSLSSTGIRNIRIYMLQEWALVSIDIYLDEFAPYLGLL